MRIQLHDDGKHLEFAPLTLTRPVGELRVGIFTNTERGKYFVKDAEIGYETESYLATKYDEIGESLVVNACVIPNQEVVDAALSLKGNEELIYQGVWLARRGTGGILIHFKGKTPIVLGHRWELYQKNAEVLAQDFDLITAGKTSVQLSSTNTIIGDHNLIFVEDGAKVEASILNTNNGPIYIGKEAEIMEGSVVRGPLALCEQATLKIGAKIYGATTIGPFCKVGGEVNNCIFQAYSNKGHEGFLGNSLIGEWCNIGADTNTSNLKNNYSKVKTYNYATGKSEQTDIQFMGLSMGDHSKCGINTMFNTATVVGVSSNIYGAEFPPKYIPSFKWGADKFDFKKAIESANNMMVRRGKQLSDADIDILRHIADKK